MHAVAGDGGNGCIAFRREKFVPRGGPSGGDGGLGGSVWLVGDERLNTLSHIRYRQVVKAQRGRHGEGSNCTGRGGEDVEARVPLGTLIFDRDSDQLVGEILHHGQRLLVAKGGLGGRGNARFANAKRRAPRYAEEGREGQANWLRLELRLLADVGLVGLPNAGKSTFISAVSSARPKIAEYPFTTLTPQLGVVEDGPSTDPFVVADLPGLIAGAADGAGLGFQFLRHVERCRVLLHLVDLSAFEGSARQDFEVIEHELDTYRSDLLERPRLLVGSKLDAVDAERRAELEQVAQDRGLEYFEVSSVTHDGLPEIKRRLRQMLAEIPINIEAHHEAEAHGESGVPSESETSDELWQGPPAGIVGEVGGDDDVEDES